MQLSPIHSRHETAFVCHPSQGNHLQSDRETNFKNTPLCHPQHLGKAHHVLSVVLSVHPKCAKALEQLTATAHRCTARTMQHSDCFSNFSGISCLSTGQSLRQTLTSRCGHASMRSPRQAHVQTQPWEPLSGRRTEQST